VAPRTTGDETDRESEEAGELGRGSEPTSYMPEQMEADSGKWKRRKGEGGRSRGGE